MKTLMERSALVLLVILHTGCQTLIAGLKNSPVCDTAGGTDSECPDPGSSSETVTTTWGGVLTTTEADEAGESNESGLMTEAGR